MTVTSIQAFYLLGAHPLKFTVERLQLVKMLLAVGRRAPRRGWPEKMVRVSACGTRVYVEANGKAAGIEVLVYGKGSCLVVHQTILRLLRGYARGKRYITFEADPCLFRIDEGNWPVAAFWKGGFPPQEYQEFSPSPSESSTTSATR